MTIYYGICVGNPDRFDRLASPGIDSVDGRERLKIVDDACSIFEGYNRIIGWARGCPDLSVLVLMHEDLEILDPVFEPRLLDAFFSSDVGIVGVVGSVQASSIRWWESGERKGRVRDPRIERCYGGWGDEVAILDGMLLALSREVVHELNFDEERYGGFHGYDADICMQAVQAGFTVTTADLPVYHHSKFGLGDRRSHFRSDYAFRKKWGLPGLSPMQLVQTTFLGAALATQLSRIRARRQR